MTNPADPGQPSQPAAVRRELCRALGTGYARGLFEVAPLLEAYRQLRPLAHPGAASDALDGAWLESALGLGGPSLLSAVHIVVSRGPPRAGITALPTARAGVVELRVPPAADAVADAFAVAAGVAREAQKLERLLDGRALDEDGLAALASAGALAGGLVEERDRRSVLAALHAGGAHRVLHIGRHGARPNEGAAIDPVVLDAATHERGGPVFVLAGASERLHDLASPYVRRLAAPLAALAGAHDEDARYDALPLLYGEEPKALEERLALEARDGVFPAGGALVLRFDAMDPALADVRARDSVAALKRSRARAVLVGRHPEALAAVLAAVGTRVRAVVTLSEGFVGEGGIAFPAFARDVETGHVLSLDNALAPPSEGAPTTVTSLPSLGLATAADGLIDTLQFPLLTAALNALADGHLTRGARLAAAVCQAGVGTHASALSLRCLARMAATSDAPAPRGRRR